MTYLKEQRDVNKVDIYESHSDTLARVRGSLSGSYPGGEKGAGCRKSDATSRSAVSSEMSPMKS